MTETEILNEVAAMEEGTVEIDRTRFNMLQMNFYNMSGKTLAQGLESREAEEAKPELAAFEVGVTYSMRSVCDYDCEWKRTVFKRTAKTVTFTDGKRCKISIHSIDGNEYCRPLGSYSMAPILSAERRA